MTNTITVGTNDHEPVAVAQGTTVESALEALRVLPVPADSFPVVACLVNNEIRALTYRIHINAKLIPVSLKSDAGQRVYRRSLCYALTIAAARVFENRRLLIGHSLGNAYYYSFDGCAATSRDLEALDSELQAIVAADLPIERTVVSYTEALDFFRSRRMEDAALLVERHNYGEVPVYRCGDFLDLSYGPLAARTGVLSTYRLELYEEGFLLLFPSADNPGEIRDEARSSMIFQIYREYKEWGRILGISSVGQLNRLAERGGIKEFIRVNEALHDKKIASIADRIRSVSDDVRVVLIAGPSSSGKTTFTKKLAVQLTVVGLIPVIISLDDYFVPRERTPRDAEGKFDFEQLGAIDVELLNEDLLGLFSGKEIALRTFNFKTGQPEYRGGSLKLPERGVLLMEGIHGLNDALTPRIPAERKYKIYVSALTQLNLDDHNRIATTDNRLIRRMVRDHQFRGHTAASTLTMWPSVRRGENKNIFPFQESADSTFNTALDYELGVLRNYAEPLLRQVKPTDELYHEAVQLQTFLKNFSVIPEKLVPQESILREFIGDSGFHY
ncbi:MAG: nucleoside kinase [Spirochaetaceae bacterium]|nr:MAG: nucleoside kinase [Spirochaetaceae bacterium]